MLRWCEALYKLRAQPSLDLRFVTAEIAVRVRSQGQFSVLQLSRMHDMWKMLKEDVETPLCPALTSKWETPKFVGGRG